MAGDIKSLYCGGAGFARPGGRVAGVMLLAACLSGCGSISEQTAATAFIAPGRFNINTCQDIEERAVALRTRQVELEQLMARASQGAGGALINAMAYRSEYAQSRGESIELAKAKADKQCASDSQFSSGRAVF